MLKSESSVKSQHAVTGIGHASRTRHGARGSGQGQAQGRRARGREARAARAFCVMRAVAPLTENNTTLKTRKWKKSLRLAGQHHGQHTVTDPAPQRRTGALSLSTGTVSQLSSPQKARDLQPQIGFGRGRTSCHRAASNGLCPRVACPRSKRASPPASQQRHDPSSSSVSSGQLCGASGAGAFSPLPPVVRAPSEGMSALSPPGGSPPRDMTSFTLGTMSPPPARSATACAMGLDLGLATAWCALLTTMPTHYDAPTAHSPA